MQSQFNFTEEQGKGIISKSMSRKEQVADLAGLLVSASISAIGFSIGGTLAPAIIGTTGVNLASALLLKGGSALRERWLSSSNGILNQDLQQALVRAFLKALGLLETEYFKQGQADALPQNEKASVKALFKELREPVQALFPSSQAVFSSSQEKIFQEPAFKDYLYGNPKAVEEKLWDRLNGDSLFRTYNEHFRDFFRKHLLDAIRRCFAEELLIEGKESNRARRAFQHFLLEGIQASQLNLQLGQQAIQDDLKKLDEVRSQLNQLHDVMERGQYHDPFQAVMEQAIRGIQPELQAISDKLSRLLDSKAKRFYALPVAHHVEELLEEYAAKLLIGREDTLMELNTFVSQEAKGFLCMTASAGFGKTALLANWVMSLRNRRPLLGQENYHPFVVYHFFNHRYKDTCSPINALRNLLRQLFAHYAPDDTPPSDRGDSEETLYGLVSDLQVRKGEPLIIVLDGLDEADEPFITLPFPSSLPEGVFVVVSARADEGEEEQVYLSVWRENAAKLTLTRLPQFAIGEWLQQIDHGTLSDFATDASFVARLGELTQGFPLYLRYLIDDLLQAVKAGQDARAVLAETPGEFKKYVRKQVYGLDNLKLPKKTWAVFALLAVAKGALRHEEIKAKALTGMSDRSLRLLSKQWQVTRWLHITREEDTILYAFAHPLLAETFAQELGGDSEKALKQLLAYCEQWSDHQSIYALQYYAEHLQENAQIEALFHLVREGTFLQAQIEAFPGNPDLPLHTVQIALRCAAEKDDAAAMAEFVLIHVRHLLKLTRLSPLQVARGGDPSYSLQIASLFRMEHRILWYLLLAWEFKEKRDGENARKALIRLQQQRLYRLQSWQGQYAANLLSQMFEVDEDLCSLLARELLHDHDLYALCESLLVRQHFPLARKVALELLKDWWRQKKALWAMLRAQVKVGMLEEARAFVQEFETELKFEGDPWGKLHKPIQLLP